MIRIQTQGQRGPAMPGIRGRGRALAVLIGLGVLAVVVLVVLGLSLGGLFSSPTPGPGAGDPDPATTPPPGAAPMTGPQAEIALARQPMLQLPTSAAMPHTLSARSAGPALSIPSPAQVSGGLVATGFPDTPEGALGQVVELTRAGMAGGDPVVWGRAYASLAEPGAAAAEQTPVSQDLVALRRAANMAPTGPREGMTISWNPTSAQVKGTAADERYTVACVLGELVVDYRGRVVTSGWGNCLPIRRVGDQWRVASGPPAWVAPSAWPGSNEAVAAGWREIRQ